MRPNRKTIVVISVILMAVLLLLSMSITAIAMLLPDGFSDFDWSGYNEKFDIGGGKPIDLNELLDRLTGAGALIPGGGGSVDPDTEIFRVYSSENDEEVFFKQGSYLNCSYSVWYAADPFKSQSFTDISEEYFTGYMMYTVDYLNRLKKLEIESVDGTAVLPYYAVIGDGIEISGTAYKNIGKGEKYEAYYIDEGKLPTSGDYLKYEAEYRDYVWKTYLELDDETEAYMKKFIEKRGFDPDDPFVIEKVANYMRTSKKYDENFDPSLEKEKNIPVAFLRNYESGVCRHFAASATMVYRALGIPARYTVGFVSDVVANTWTTVRGAQAHAWVEIYVDGFGWKPVDVTPPRDGGSADDKKQITIAPENIEVQGDESTVVSHTGKIVGFEKYEALGYYYDVTVSGEQYGYGRTSSKILGITIYDKNGVDVTTEFEIKRRDGYIHVYYSVLEFTSAGASKIYDGLTLTSHRVNPSADNRYYDAGHVYKASFSAAPINVGRVANSFGIKIYDAGGNNVTSHYKLVYSYGALEIRHAEIEIKAKDASKTYDGKPLTCPEYEWIRNGLIDGHYIDGGISIVGSQTERGHSENIIDIDSIIIRDGFGNNVTANYVIKTYVGHLKVN